MALIDLANPTRFLSLAHRAHPWLMEITAATFVIGTLFIRETKDVDIYAND